MLFKISCLISCLEIFLLSFSSNSIIGILHLWLNYLPRVLPPNIITFWLQHMNSGGTPTQLIAIFTDMLELKTTILLVFCLFPLLLLSYLSVSYLHIVEGSMLISLMFLSISGLFQDHPSDSVPMDLHYPIGSEWGCNMAFPLESTATFKSKEKKGSK